MGNARSIINNKSNRKLCVLTFNEADLLYQYYTNFYSIDLGESKEVHALSNPIGLKYGIIIEVNVETREVTYQMWRASNYSILNVTYMNGSDIYAEAEADGAYTFCVGKIIISDPKVFARITASFQYESVLTRSHR